LGREPDRFVSPLASIEADSCDSTWEIADARRLWQHGCRTREPPMHRTVQTADIPVRLGRQETRRRASQCDARQISTDAARLGTTRSISGLPPAWRPQPLDDVPGPAGYPEKYGDPNWIDQRCLRSIPTS
jgi:hypothetical protein